MVKPLQEPPEWASDQHIGNGGTCWCAHCLRYQDEQVEVEVTDTKRLATWMGVNWEDGFVEIVECPNCGHSGKLKTKLMNEYRERTKFHKERVAAFEDALAEMEPDGR
jgi:Zn ribbon nucleic-acid-binding protein